MSSQTPKPKGKGAESQVPDDGIPKEIVTFKIAFNIIQNDLSDIVVLYQWVDSANTSSRVMLSADIPKDWTKANPSDSKNLNYSKEFAAVIVEEKFAKNLCSDKFQILFVSKMDQVVQDKIELHYSPLLFPTTEPKFEFTCKSFSNPNIESFTVTVTANKPLLSPAYREHLNPLLITVEAAKNLPVNSDSTVEYIPAYVVCKFFDEGVVKTHSIRASSKCKWAYKQVILLGLMSPIKLTAWIKTSFLEFQVHDRDEAIKPKQPRKEMVLAEIKYESKDLTQEDSIEKTPGKKTSMKDIKKSTPKLPADPSPDKKPLEKIEKKPKIEPKKPANYSKIEPIFVEDTRKIKTTNYGVAQFTLTPFVETDMTTLKLKRNIVPINKHEEEKDELNESGITIFEKPKDSSPRANYLDKESYLSVSFDLAYPIGPLNNTSNSPVKKSTRKAEDNYTSTPKSVRTKSRESKISLDGSKENLKSVSVSQPEEDSKLKFERAVFLFSTNFQHERTEFLKEVRAINLETFGKEETDLFYLGFKKLTEEEKKNSDLDIITGVEFIDKEFHVFIVEGLADKAMKRLGKGFPETHPYDRNIRIIRNDEFKFEDRLYIDFNIDIKKIWFTKNISEIIIQPEIYVRSKVPENIYQTLKTINEIRKCHNLRGVFLQNLFPLTKDILVIEKMYGDTSMYEDLNGNKSTPFRNIDLKSSSIVKPPVEPNSKRTDPDLDVSIEISSRRGSKSSKISSRQAEIIRINEISAGIQKLINKSKFDLYYLHAKNPSSRSSDSEVFIHGNQSLNYYANQRAELRKSIRQDPNNFYTYSKDYMSAAIDPYEIDEVRQEDYKNKKSQWKTPDGFQNVIKKSLDHYISHPLKPVQGKIEAMVEYPWYREKHDQEKMQKQIRGASLKSDRQPDFNLSPKAKGLSHRNDCWPDSPPKIAPERSSSVNQNHKSTNGSPTLEPIKGARSSQTKKLSAPPAEKDLPKPNKDQAPMSIFLTERWRDKEVQYPVDRDFDKRKSPGGVDFDVVNHNPSQFSPVHKRNKKAAF